MSENDVNEEKDKALVVKTFSDESISNYGSYGDKSLIENIQNADKSMEKVQYTERIWDRSRSQFMLKFLTCSQADDWTRMRQISAEMSNKRRALSEAKFSYMESQLKVKIKREKAEKESDPLKKELLEVQAAKMQVNANEMLVKFEGALKEVETLGEMHDQLKERIGEINEEQFEKAQTISHIKRAMMQSVREVRECGTIKCGNQEYLEQVGVSVTSAKKEIMNFLAQESETGVANTSLLHMFLEDFANRYEPAVKQQAEWLGFNVDSNNLLTYTPDANQKQLEESKGDSKDENY